MVHLSGVVATASFLPALLVFSYHRQLPVPANVLLAHIAGAGMLVALAASSPLARHTTMLLGKKSDGRIHPLGLAAMWPYHAALRAKLAVQRRVSSEPAWSQVTGNYFVGAWPSEELLVPAVKPAVLDVTCELPLQVTPPAYLSLFTWDTHCPTVEQLDLAVDWARSQSHLGRPILVHCAHGHGRSATVLGAILLAEGVAASVEEAEGLMRAVRPRVGFNSRQRAGLEAWFRHWQRMQ